jgi:hypothetical protein
MIKSSNTVESQKWKEKSIFLLNNLRMSKKSSNFAAGFKTSDPNLLNTSGCKTLRFADRRA